MTADETGLVGLGGRIARLAGWRCSLLAVLSGVAVAAALPPAHVLPLLIVGFTSLTWLTAGSRTRWRAFLTGWWFGIGHFLAAFYWIGAALLTDPERYGAVVVPAVIGLAAGFALFTGAALALVHVSRARGLARVVALAVAWALAEWLRGHILTGFPMGLIGTVWTVSDAMVQVVSLVGVYGLGFITVLAAAMPACLAGTGDLRQRWLPVGAAGLLLVAIGLFGVVRLAGAPDGTVPDIRLRLVQLSVPQDLKWQTEARDAIVAEYFATTRNPGFDLISHVIWPETALPYRVADEPVLLEALAELVPANGLLFTGSVRSDIEAGGLRRYWNSVFAIDGQGVPVATYDKAHLVPFGEFMPFRSVVSAAKLTHGTVDFTNGPGAVTLALPGLPPLSPLICYEAIFPGAVVALNGATRPAWLLNVTNDGWFGTTSGPYQHFASARLRAVEEGLPLIRAANSGISAVVDAHGRVKGKLGVNRRGVLDGELPVALGSPPLYARIGDGLLFCMLVVAAIFVLARNKVLPIKN